MQFVVIGIFQYYHIDVQLSLIIFHMYLDDIFNYLNCLFRTYKT